MLNARYVRIVVAALLSLSIDLKLCRTQYGSWYCEQSSGCTVPRHCSWTCHCIWPANHLFLLWK